MYIAYPQKLYRMKKYVLLVNLIFICLFSSLVVAQTQELPKLSPLTKLYLLKTKKSNVNQPIEGYVYRTANNNIYISALIKVSNLSVVENLNNIGAKIGTKAGDIWTVHLPIDKVDTFTKIKGIAYIQLDEPAFPTLDSARRTTHADSAQAGYGLPQPYNGDGVVVGIVDAGFDYGHPDFFDTSGHGFRIRKVWEQKTSGNPPSGFSFGNEMTDSLAMWAAKTDNNQTPHGTHVAGIAAGAGFENASNGNNSRYRGMAFQSDIAMVGITPPKSQWMNTGCSDMIDGMNYIYTYAAAQGKPAVINLSWGSPLGPRDGSGLFSQACDNLTGIGKIFVCSAGNNGDNNIHLKKHFTPTDTIVHTFLNIASNPLGKITWVDAWGDTAKTFCVQVRLYFGVNAVDSTGFICLDNNVHSFNLIGANGDTCQVSITTSAADFNMKPRVFFEFNNKAVNNSICISLKGQDGTVNMWNSFVHETTGYYGSFAKSGKVWAVNGDKEMTISDIAATKSALTVGAYASKTTYVNVSNNTASYASYVAEGNLAPFSSHGPTVDGRIKPDIAGPGLVVGAALSSYDSAFMPTGVDYSSVQTVFTNPSNGKDYAYGMLMGTSMSSPAVAGIVAMMLQANPNLTPTQVQNAIAQTALLDNYTGNLTAMGNNLWGHGKVNAYAAIKKSLQLLSVNETGSPKFYATVFPNPNEGTFTVAIDCVNNGDATIQIMDMMGKIISKENWKLHSGYNTKTLRIVAAKGIYMMHITTMNSNKTIKIVVE